MGDEKHNASRKDKNKKKLFVKKQCTASDVYPYKCNKYFVKIKPFITADSKHIVCSSGSKVLIFRLKTGVLEKVFDEHKKNVIAIFPHEKNPLQVISCTEDEVVMWDCTDLTVYKKFILPCKIFDVYMPTAKSGVTIYFVSTVKKEIKKNKTVLFRYNVLTQEMLHVSVISKGYKKFAVSKCESFIAIIYRKYLKIYNCNKQSIVQYKYDAVSLTCVAIHPSSDVIVTGDEDGRLILWNDICGEQKEPICSKLHWHNNYVNDVLFMNDGFYIVSGGNEGVLVIWQLENHKKNYLPRVGGSILHLFQSNDSQHLGFAIDSNVIKLLSVHDTKLTKAIKGFSIANDFPAGISYDSKTGCLVMNGKPDGVIQFYNPQQDMVKINLDVVGENLITSVEDRHIYPSRIERIAFSQDSSWLATIVIRKDVLLPTERTLKLWKYYNNKFYLNSVVEPVHSDDVCVLLFRPHKSNYYAITSSKDGNIKSWQLAEGKNSQGKQIQAWELHSIGTYGKQSCHQACFSDDGSLLAALFSEITIWDPDNLSLESTISWNCELDPIKSLMFCHKESNKYLIGCSDNTIVSWNVSTLEIAWKMQCEVKLITSDPSSKYFAAFIWFKRNNKMHLYLFDPCVPTPAGLICNIQQDFLSLKSAIFTPRLEHTVGNTIWTKIGVLYYLKDNSIMKIVEADEIKTNNKESNIPIENSAFTEIFGAAQKQNVNDSNGASIPTGNTASMIIQKILSTPSHVLPSTDVLCKVFLKSFLISKSSHAKLKDTNNDIDDDKDDICDQDRINSEVVAISPALEDLIPIDHIKLPSYDFAFMKEMVET
ncbi:WD repeat-containing protein 75 isoform X2 [Hydra vulgaris]|uniref:WD repeat-containing protein 75 isoform X2 n=1 Tax=Hydra vulgaris TaxID=6087 RepID=A0ABM4CX97_HYDVU